MSADTKKTKVLDLAITRLIGNLVKGLLCVLVENLLQQ